MRKEQNDMKQARQTDRDG